MFMVSFISRPECLNANLVLALQEKWGGGEVNNLSPGEAAEFLVMRRPPRFARTQRELSRQGVDMHLLPAGERRKRLLLADMDSTVIEQECIDELAAVAGLGREVSQITERAMNGDLDFNTALIERVALLKDLPTSIIAEVIRDRITIAKGALCLINTMRAHGAYCALVSGGFTDFTQVISARLGFHYHRANHLAREDDVLTGEVVPPILGRAAKVEAMVQLMAARQIGPEDVIAVGDGANDLDMLQRAGMGVALHAKPAVAAEAKIRIDHGDLTALLYLQGYAREEFAA